MNDYPTCPHCNYDLEIDDCFDIDFDGGKVISHWNGHCHECGKDFRWKEVYLLDRVEELVEVE